MPVMPSRTSHAMSRRPGQSMAVPAAMPARFSVMIASLGDQVTWLRQVLATAAAELVR